MGKIVWCEVTRNCHVGKLKGAPVVSVVRRQKHLPDGTKGDWRIEVLGDPYTWDKMFRQYDPRDIDSTKSAAEARVRWAIGLLYQELDLSKTASLIEAARAEGFAACQAAMAKIIGREVANYEPESYTALNRLRVMLADVGAAERAKRNR